jgi:hypothetical protein
MNPVHGAAITHAASKGAEEEFVRLTFVRLTQLVTGLDLIAAQLPLL